VSIGLAKRTTPRHSSKRPPNKIPRTRDPGKLTLLFFPVLVQSHALFGDQKQQEMLQYESTTAP
jgi:hypothetical protein